MEAPGETPVSHGPGNKWSASPRGTTLSAACTIAMPLDKKGAPKGWIVTYFPGRREGVDRICFPDHRKSIPGGCDKNVLFLTLWKTNIDPLVVRTVCGGSVNPIQPAQYEKKQGPEGPCKL